MVNISRISRLEVICKKIYAFVQPAIELIYMVEKHNSLININGVEGVPHQERRWGAGVNERCYNSNRYW